MQKSHAAHSCRSPLSTQASEAASRARRSQVTEQPDGSRPRTGHKAAFAPRPQITPPCRSDFSPTPRVEPANSCRTKVRIWTPPVLPARMLDNKGIDCSRISGLLVGRSGPGHDELSARLLLIDLACSRHIGFGRVFRRRFDRFVIGDSCWAIVRKVLLLKLSS